MEWGGGGIGWRDGFSEQVSHPLSGSSNSSDIGCLYSNTYSAIAYIVHCKCATMSVQLDIHDYNVFECTNCIKYSTGCVT